MVKLDINFLIYIKRPKQFLEVRASLPAEAAPNPFKGDAQNPREKEKKDFFSPILLRFCQKSDLGVEYSLLNRLSLFA